MWINKSVTFNTGKVMQLKDGERDGEQDRMIVYLINRLKNKQVLTHINLFRAAATEDKLAWSGIQFLRPRNKSARLYAVSSWFMYGQFFFIFWLTLCHRIHKSKYK